MKNMLVLNRKKLAYCLPLLYILNCIDLLFTYTYIKLGGFYEVNPIIRNVIYNPFLSVLVKILLPGLLITYLCLNIDKLVLPSYRLFHYGILLVLGIYMVIDLMHCCYLFIFISSFY